MGKMIWWDGDVKGSVDKVELALAALDQAVNDGRSIQEVQALNDKVGEAIQQAIMVVEAAMKEEKQ